MTEGHGLHLQFHIIGWDVLAGVVETDSIVADEIAKHHLFSVVVEPFPVSSSQSLQESVVGLVILNTIGNGIRKSGVDGGIDVLSVIIDDIIDNVVECHFLKRLTVGGVVKQGFPAFCHNIDGISATSSVARSCEDKSTETDFRGFLVARVKREVLDIFGVEGKGDFLSDELAT